MNLLDTASLVVTPNGYKASKLYSIIPSDGTGDMTFARTGDTATRVNSSGLIETVLANKPRLDYLVSTCPKLLLEPQRTNLVRYSQDIDNAAWGISISNATVTKTANYAISPDGSSNADRLEMNLTGAGYADVTQSIAITNGTTYTYSVYLKANTGTPTLKFLYDGTANRAVTLNSSWVRYTYTFVGSSGYATPRFLIQSDTSSTADILVYGAQLEAGAYATSYIPTTTASVTRNADSCSKTGITSLIGQTEGTIFVDFNYTQHSKVESLLSLQGATSASYVEMYFNNSNQITIGIYNGGSVSSSYTATLTNGRYKIGFAYKENDFKIYINGLAVHTDTSGTVPALSSIQIGNDIASTAYPFTGFINSTTLWKTRLQNSELATLTSL